MSETLDLFSAENGDSAGLPVPVSQPADQPVGVADSAGTSHRPAGAVRSWPDAVDTATASGDASAASPGESGGKPKALSAMLLPELQRVAQSVGITGTARMRKGQLIAAIEEKRQGGGLRATEAQGQVPADRQIRTSDKSVQRGAPAGAGADRTFERDAMESQTSAQPGVGANGATGIGEGSSTASTGIGTAPADAGRTTVNGSSAPAEVQQTGDGQRPERRRRSLSLIHI